MIQRVKLLLEFLPCVNEGAVRLTSLSRLEVCLDGHWGTVCNNTVSPILVNVVCRQLDFAALGLNEYTCMYTLSIYLNLCVYTCRCNIYCGLF